MSSIALDEYKKAMRDAVCNVCVYFSMDSQNSTGCVHENTGQCSLFRNLSEVVDLVSNVHSGSIAPYLEALRVKVCAKCEHQDEHGICDVRDNRGPAPIWCTLDAYFNLVVGAVEDVRERRASTARITPPT
jgi:hypothetical protein